MPKKNTWIKSLYRRIALPAAGVHDPDKAKTYFFKDFGRKRNITIGRGSNCDIRLKDMLVSNQHLVLKRRRGGVVSVYDENSANGTYIDGELTLDPFVLAFGMTLKLGRAPLYVVNDDGRFPISAVTVDDLYIQSVAIYGNYSVAGRRLGVSPETVRLRVVKLQQEESA